MTYPILQSGYAFEHVNGTIVTIEPSVGMAYAQRMSMDEPFVFSVTWQTTDRDAFEAWAQSVTISGYTETLQIEAGEPVAIDVVFTEAGYPQLQSVRDGAYTYSGELFANVVNNPDDGLYEQLLFGAENSEDGDPETFYDILDIAINEVLPTSNRLELIAFGRAKTQPPIWQNHYAMLDVAINQTIPEALHAARSILSRKASQRCAIHNNRVLSPRFWRVALCV